MPSPLLLDFEPNVEKSLFLRTTTITTMIAMVIKTTAPTAPPAMGAMDAFFFPPGSCANVGKETYKKCEYVSYLHGFDKYK